MRFSIDGKFIYLLNELDLSVTTFAYNADKGSADARSTTPALSQEVKSKELFNSASEIVVHDNGKFVYSANRGNDSVTAFQTDPATGALRVIEVEPIRGAWPRNINLIDNWLIAAGARSNTLSVFAIDSTTGTLTYQTKSSRNVPGPICILFKK
jgi:6-phosphogluconolactonase